MLWERFLSWRSPNSSFLLLSLLSQELCLEGSCCGWGQRGFLLLMMFYSVTTSTEGTSETIILFYTAIIAIRNYLIWCWGSGNTAPKYGSLACCIFFAESIWEGTATQTSYWKWSCEKCPPYTWGKVHPHPDDQGTPRRIQQGGLVQVPGERRPRAPTTAHSPSDPVWDTRACFFGPFLYRDPIADKIPKFNKTVYSSPVRLPGSVAFRPSRDPNRVDDGRPHGVGVNFCPQEGRSQTSVSSAPCLLTCLQAWSRECLVAVQYMFFQLISELIFKNIFIQYIYHSVTP